MPDGARYAIANVAVILAAIGVRQAIRVFPVRDVEVEIGALAP